MSQGDIIICLEKASEPLSRSQIAEIIKLPPNRVSYLLSRLLKFKEVKLIEIDRYEAEERFGVKRKVGLYYI